MENVKEKDQYKLSRVLYVIEAALEYFIALGVGSTYLPVLGAAIGLSEGLIAILESFVSLGCGFQIFAVFLLGKKRVKPTVTLLHIISQVFFSLTWFVPIFRFSNKAKAILFVVLLMVAHVLHNVIFSPKTNWYMSLIEDKKRGRFTAVKEIVSLLSGMIFTAIYGGMIDYFEGKGEVVTAFILCGSLLLFITLSHTLTLIFSKEKAPKDNEENKVEKTLGAQIKSIVKDKTLIKVIIVPILWNVVQYSCNPFYAIYQRKVMGLDTMTISIIMAVCSVIRAIFSTPLGRYADKNSFSKMLNVCFIFVLISFMFNLFSGFIIGGVLSVIAVSGFWVFNYISMAGINSGITNIIYDYVDKDRQMIALAFKNSIAGIIGFLTTLAFAPVVDWLNGLDIFLLGNKIYAQQILALLGIVLTIVIMVYNRKIVGAQKRDVT